MSNVYYISYIKILIHLKFIPVFPNICKYKNIFVYIHVHMSNTHIFIQKYSSYGHDILYIWYCVVYHLLTGYAALIFTSVFLDRSVRPC